MPHEYGKVTLRWNRNGEADLAGYHIHYGTSPTILNRLVNVGMTATPNNPEVTLPISYHPQFLEFGQLYFAVSAYDTSNNFSDLTTPLTIGVAPFLMPLAWG